MLSLEQVLGEWYYGKRGQVLTRMDKAGLAEETCPDGSLCQYAQKLTACFGGLGKTPKGYALQGGKNREEKKSRKQALLAGSRHWRRRCSLLPGCNGSCWEA